MLSGTDKAISLVLLETFANLCHIAKPLKNKCQISTL